MNLNMRDAVALWRAGNNSGDGYAPHGETIAEAVAILLEEGGDLILDCLTSEDVAVVLDSAGELIAIGGDGSGGSAWAVVIVGADDVAALRAEAARAGDLEQVALCDLASSDRGAMCACALVITDCAAQS